MNFFILSELKPSLNCSVFTEPSGSGPRMAQTWPIEGPTFLQDKGSYQLPHAFMLRLFFHSGSLSHSNFPCLPSSILMPCWRLLLNRKMNTSWNDLPWKLRRNDHLNSDFVTVLLSQTVLIRIPAKAISIFFFWSQIFSNALGKWPYFHFLSWYTYFLFIAGFVDFDIGNLTKLSYWLLNDDITGSSYWRR